jgi:hypothetical protein
MRRPSPVDAEAPPDSRVAQSSDRLTGSPPWATRLRLLLVALGLAGLWVLLSAGPAA